MNRIVNILKVLDDRCVSGVMLAGVVLAAAVVMALECVLTALPFVVGFWILRALGFFG